MTAAPLLGVTERLRKLQAMSAAELSQRVQYRLRLARERRLHRRGRLAPADRLERALVRRLRGGNWRERLLAARGGAPRLFESLEQCDRMRALFATRFSGELSATWSQAADVRARRFAFFGGQYEYAADIPWQQDPVTGRSWPSLYHADVPVHRGDVGCGDVKHVWELSRQQYLVDLGKAWFLGGGAENVEAIQELVRGWIAGNPYATGVNWACALEPAFRAFSWLWAYHFVSDAIGDEFHLEWLQGFYDHARFIDAHMEHYSSPYNHLIGEAASLFLIAAAFPDFESAPRWRSKARAVLEGRLREQFYRDGGSVEQSTFYHHATVGYYLLAAIVGRRIGEDLNAGVWDAIERGIEFSMHLAQPDGRTPEIGGADDGKPIRMEHLPFWDFRTYQAIGAVLFRRGDFKAAAGRFYEDALWLTGPAGLDVFDALPEPATRRAATALPHSGYYVLRTADSRDYVCFDCGEQAAGMRADAVPNSMHGHADCLSVVVWLAGRRLLVDSGFYAYNCGGSWEAHFRETAAHNTARVDGRDQARHIGKMAWSHSYRASLEGWSAGSGEAWAIGSHDGFARGPHGVVHRRGVWLRPSGILLIADEFTGAGAHELEVNFQFAPGTLQLGESGVVFDGAADLAWSGSGMWTAAAARGGEGPDEGWVAPSLGIREPAPRLSLKSQMNPPRAVLLSVLATRAAGMREPRVQRVESGGVLLRIAGAHAEEWVTIGASGGAAVETDGIIAVCRTDGSGSVESRQIGGSRVRVDERALTALRERHLEGRP